jgi:hypothetical protein
MHLLAVLAAALLTALGPIQPATAAGAEPPPPKPAKPRGPGPVLSFDKYGPSPSDDVVLRWDEQTLAAVRATKPGPTVVARALAVVHTSIYDAWAAYDATAVGTRLGGSLRRPKSEHTNNYKSKAISYAAYRTLMDLFPARKADFTGFMTDLGYNPNDASTDTTTPVGIGNVVAAAVLDFRHNDGANQLNGYADTCDPACYAPVNSWDTVTDPYRWQPLCVPLPPPGATSCAGKVQQFATPHWGKVTPFALTSPSQFGPPGLDTTKLAASAADLIRTQAGLTDYQKTVAYYWADGPGSELPPGHWAMFAQAASRAANLNLDANAKGFFALGNGLLDASIATWNAKVVNDSVRPITYIRSFYKGQQVQGWGGPGKGTVTEDGADWIPYQEAGVVTPPFAEYTSGHSAFSGTASEIFNQVAGTDLFGFGLVTLTVTVPAGSSTIEPKLVPTTNTTLRFSSFTDAANQAGLSRRYGGIHFDQGDYDGRTLGHDIGVNTWTKAKTYFNGTAR